MFSVSRHLPIFTSHHAFTKTIIHRFLVVVVALLLPYSVQDLPRSATLQRGNELPCPSTIQISSCAASNLELLLGGFAKNVRSRRREAFSSGWLSRVALLGRPLIQLAQIVRHQAGINPCSRFMVFHVTKSYDSCITTHFFSSNILFLCIRLFLSFFAQAMGCVVCVNRSSIHKRLYTCATNAITEVTRIDVSYVPILGLPMRITVVNASNSKRIGTVVPKLSIWDQPKLMPFTNVKSTASRNDEAVWSAFFLFTSQRTVSTM